MFIAAGAFAVAGCGNGAGDPAARFKPVATVDQIMDAIVIPSSQAIFDAVVYSNGELTESPKTDDDWFAIQMHAMAVAEAGNLLLIPPRAQDTGDWSTFARGMNDEAVTVAKAAEAKDIDRLLDAGGKLYSSCTACHAKYLPMAEQ
jgi:hypothetical protein